MGRLCIIRPSAIVGRSHALLASPTRLHVRSIRPLVLSPFLSAKGFELL